MPSDTERKTRKPRRDRGNNNGGFSLPSELVCTAHGAATTKNGVEVGILMSAFVIGLYLFGFYESMVALPDVPNQRELGRNLNMARLHDASEHKRALEEETWDDDTGESWQVGEDGKDTTKSKGVPEAIWPVSLKEEGDDQLEELLHPGDLNTIMTLPTFWSPPLHNNKQFERETAMKVGSCATPDPVTDSNVRGDKCPLDERTIFIAIASYRDFQCRQTVESAFRRAKNPDRIRIGIVDQIVDGEDPVCDEPMKPCEEDQEQAQCKYAKQIDVYKMEAKLSIGPVFARHIGYRMYRGEYYATQSDAHVTFTQNWDSDIIEQMEATHNEMAVLTTYLTDVQGSIDEDGHSLLRTRPIMCNTFYEGGVQGNHLRHGSQPERVPSIHGMPQLSPWWAAGYSFSRGHFVVNVPYDPYQPMIFQGEEMSIGIRGFTIGYDYYAPERSVCFHHYAIGKNAKIRHKVKHFWENGNLYAGTGKKAMSRLLGIVHMNPEVDPKSWDHKEEGRYGIGNVRTPEKFYETYGIDVHKQTTQGHLCLFVDEGKGTMHKEFTPFLRSDGMGIDYSKIHYQWSDPTTGGVPTSVQ